MLEGYLKHLLFAHCKNGLVPSACMILFSLFRSEHERHSPKCPFVRGECTENVPLSISMATSPAQFHNEQKHKVSLRLSYLVRNILAGSRARIGTRLASLCRANFGTLIDLVYSVPDPRGHDIILDSF